MKFQGLSVTDWISDNWVWKSRVTAYLSKNIFSRTKLWIPWTFASTIAIYGTPTSNCDTPPSTSGERGYTVIDVHFVINNSWISFSVGALRTQKQLICSIYNRTCRCRAWFGRRYFWYWIYFANCNWIVFADICKFLLTNIHQNMIWKTKDYPTHTISANNHTI
jgi:hypothetical protein